MYFLFTSVVLTSQERKVISNFSKISHEHRVAVANLCVASFLAIA